MLDPYVKYMPKRSNPGGGEILRTRPDRPWDPPTPHPPMQWAPGLFWGKSSRGVALTTQTI
jgi:hypothetical protein